LRRRRRFIIVIIIIIIMDQTKQQRPLDPVRPIEWRSLPEELLPSIMSHLDVKTLIEKKRVCSTWRYACTEAIDNKQTKAFSTNEELRQAVKKYCGCNKRYRSYTHCRPQDAEEFAQTYGYPINKWDVSNLQDFSYIFWNEDTFNEDISSWNVSNATTMRQMFFEARSFNQNLSRWNVQNVTNMHAMFEGADAFNQNISDWKVSNVTNMIQMFRNATRLSTRKFRIGMYEMSLAYMIFDGADAFNQNVFPWDVFERWR
jgi:surface protein